MSDKSPKTAKFSVDVGILRCGEMRDILNKVKFEGANIEWIESGGLLSHEFTIKGSFNDVIALYNALRAAEDKPEEDKNV